ncbi:chromosome transmission fidelity protein 8 homolog [Anabrus simplex]|uniref:chromosome transmission fidelity protein 8 homolog n=1 Tax=Anabrus simplex TaxID=316456 RepID=UPI0034DD5035
MPIVVKIPTETPPGEWAVIELQGDLESRLHDSLHSQYIGDLHYTTKNVPVLIVGHHILFGKEQALPKPFAVLERKRFAVGSENVAEGEAMDIADENINISTEYIVKAIVKKKLLFKTRPKPIIANIPKVL